MDHMKAAAALTEEEARRLVDIRRRLHRHPETGWTEFRTTALIAHELEACGYTVHLGEEVIDPGSMMGVPSEQTLTEAEHRARLEGVPDEVLNRMKGGMTGAVATIGTGRPVIAFRFDIDALPIAEARGDHHRPFREQFRSEEDHVSHACGHDGHVAIGVALGRYLAEHRRSLPCTVKLIFQPAEEGCRGALAMVRAGVLDDVDILICLHLGLIAGSGTVVAGAGGFLASTKYEAIFTGTSAHAGLEPEKGRNALLAAASAVLQLHAIERHSKAETRVNVGVLEAGSGTNVVPSFAKMQFEIRASDDEGLRFLDQRAKQIMDGVSVGYGVKVNLKMLGHASTADSDPELTALIAEAAHEVPGVDEVLPTARFGASDDATLMMRRVQERGGKAAYITVGSDLQSGHHTPAFDFDENSLLHAVCLLKRSFHLLTERDWIL